MLQTPLALGPLELPHRVLMAPLTRQRASAPGDVPNALMAQYYTQRASAGLIISEGTQISAEGKGYADTPGIYSDEQIAGWQVVTQAVHAAGGRIAAQLWHTGRVGHESLHDGALPVSASAIAPGARTSLKRVDGTIYRADCPTPRALEIEELPCLVADYAAATQRAREAGFDAVEIHAAHGYLLHQFMGADSNVRTDAYGGSLENRARLVLEVMDAVAGAWEPSRVGIRISPSGAFHGVTDAPDGPAMGLHVARAAAQRGLAFLHLSEPDWAGGPAVTDTYREQLRDAYDGVLVGAGSYTADKAERLLAAGLIDAAAFGRPFIANPDLPHRLAVGAELNEQRRELFYGGGAEGYVDYPALAG